MYFADRITGSSTFNFTNLSTFIYTCKLVELVHDTFSLPGLIRCVCFGESASGGAVASWLVRSSPERTVRVRALAGDTVLCSWAGHLTLTAPLSTQEYKWVPANFWGKPNKLRGNDLRWTSIPSRGSGNTVPSRFMLQKPGISSGAMSQ